MFERDGGTWILNEESLPQEVANGYFFFYAVGAVESTLWNLELPFLRVTGLVRAIACMQQTSQLRFRDSSV